MQSRLRFATAFGFVSITVFLAWTAIGHPADDFQLVSTITFTSTRDAASPIPLLAGEIYLMDEDGTNLRRLTDNAAGEGFSSLSPDGKKIVFDSNRNRAAT